MVNPLVNWSVTRSRTREDNIKMDLMDTRCDDRRWMELAQNRVHWRVW